MSVMTGGQRLYVGEELTENGVSLAYQGDGNLVLYAGSQPIWASMTFHNPGHLEMQGDGNLVIYNKEGAPVWASGSFALEPELRISISGLEVIASSVVWRGMANPVPGPGPGPGPIPTNLSRLSVEDNKRWFKNDVSRFDFREISSFSLLSRLLTGEDDYVRDYMRTVRGMGFTVIRVILTLDGDYWTRTNPHGRSFRCAPDMPNYWQKLDLLVRLASEEGLYIRAVFVGAVEPFGGVWHSDRRDVWNGSVREKGDAFMVEAAQRLAPHTNVIFELCNEPGQIGMRDSFDDLIAVGRKVKAVAPSTLLGLGAVDGPNDNDTRLCVSPADYVDSHVHRLMGIWGFEWVKRTGEYATIDPEHQPTDMPFISGEPVNFGEWRVDGRNGDVERQPAVAFAYAAVSRSRQYNTNFHYDGGLWTTLPNADTEASIKAYMSALDAFPMLTDNKWRGHWSAEQGNYWNKDSWPAKDDHHVVEDHIRNGRGPWRAFGCGPFSVLFPVPKNWDWNRNLTAPADLIAFQDGEYPCAVFRRKS